MINVLVITEKLGHSDTQRQDNMKIQREERCVMTDAEIGVVAVAEVCQG